MRFTKLQAFIGFMLAFILMSACNHNQGGLQSSESTVTRHNSSAQSARGNPAALSNPAASRLKGQLIKATINNDYARVRTLLSAGADVNDSMIADGHKITPLLVAVALQNDSIARLLIDHHADTQVAYMGYTARDFAFHLADDDLAHELMRTPTQTMGNQR